MLDASSASSMLDASSASSDLQLYKQPCRGQGLLSVPDRRCCQALADAGSGTTAQAAELQHSPMQLVVR